MLFFRHVATGYAAQKCLDLTNLSAGRKTTLTKSKNEIHTVSKYYTLFKKQWLSVKLTLVFQIKYTGIPNKTHWCLDKNTLVNSLKHTGVFHKTHW